MVCPARARFQAAGGRSRARDHAAKLQGIILTSPSNPTGAAYTHAELKALTDVLVRHPQVWVMTGTICTSIWSVAISISLRDARAGRAEAVRSHADGVNGVSMVYCMTGWRIGYARWSAAAASR